MVTDELRPEDIPVFSLTVQLKTTEFIQALNAVAIAAKYQNYKAIFMVINPANVKGIALVGGNEKNLMFVNIHEQVDRSQSMVSFAFDPSKISSMIRGLEDETCTMILDAASENLIIKDSRTTYTLVRMGLDTKWVSRVLSLDAKKQNQSPVAFAMSSDCFDDLSVMSGCTFGDMTDDQNNKVFVLISEKKVAFVKSTSKVITLVKHIISSNLDEKTTMVVPFTSNSVRNVIAPFINYKDETNMVYVFDSFIRVEKTGAGSFCMIPRSTSTSTPFGLIKRLTKYANKTGHLICERDTLNRLGNKVSAVIQDSSIATKLNYANGRIQVEHNTSSGSVKTEIPGVEHVFFKRDGCNATSDAENVQMCISAVSINRLTEIIKYYYQLSRQTRNKKEPVTLKLFKGGYMSGRDPNVDSMDYLLIGSEEDEYVLISCHVDVASDNIPTYIPTLIE